jgi:hypothetical protein
VDRISLFNKYSESPVYLEEHNHVYVHKETGNLYNSVTTALSLLKSDFEKDNIIEAIIKQYTNFINWYRRSGGNETHLKDLLFDYIMYGKQRPYSTYQDKKIYKALTKYANPQELADELTQIRERSEPIMLKGFYLNPDHTVMTKAQILNIWDATNMLSRHYGHMIHESLELFFLDVQGFSIDRLKKIQNIQHKYDELNTLLSSLDKGFNKEFFSVYELDLSAIEFMEWIIHKFKEVRPYRNEIIIPEKVNFSPTYQICGTTDVEVVFNDLEFEIEDHKTNKAFTFTNEYGKTLKYPMDDLEESSFSTYALQLNIYGHIQEVEFGRQFKGARITYFDRQKKQFELIELPLMLDRAKKVLENFLSFQNKHKEAYLASGIFDGLPKTQLNVLTKLLYDDIEKRKKNNSIDLNDKVNNRKYYSDFCKKISNNLSLYI